MCVSEVLMSLPRDKRNLPVNLFLARGKTIYKIKGESVPGLSLVLLLVGCVREPPLLPVFLLTRHGSARTARCVHTPQHSQAPRSIPHFNVVQKDNVSFLLQGALGNCSKRPGIQSQSADQQGWMNKSLLPGTPCRPNLRCQVSSSSPWGRHFSCDVTEAKVAQGSRVHTLLLLCFSFFCFAHGLTVAHQDSHQLGLSLR